MCFAPQRRALFRHLNFQKWSDHGFFCTFWLRNVLCATTACNFSSLIWPAGSAPAALASLLFDPPEPQIIGKHSVSRLSYLFAHLHLLSSYSFSSTLLSSNLSLLSASSLLCFSSVHIVGSLTSKLPSIIRMLPLLVIIAIMTITITTIMTTILLITILIMVIKRMVWYTPPLLGVQVTHMKPPTPLTKDKHGGFFNPPWIPWYSHCMVWVCLGHMRKPPNQTWQWNILNCILTSKPRLMTPEGNENQPWTGFWNCLVDLVMVHLFWVTSESVF